MVDFISASIGAGIVALIGYVILFHIGIVPVLSVAIPAIAL